MSAVMEAERPARVARRKSAIPGSVRRERLFHRDRPIVRRLEIMDGEAYTRDIGYLWAAYEAGSFPDLKADMDQNEFLAAIEQLQKAHDQVWIIDDFNAAYKGGRGPVALVCTKAFQLVVNAEGCVFKWATRRNLLRCAASFLNMIRHSKKTGICMVKGGREVLPLLRRLTAYELLFYIGKSAPNEYLFSVRGRGSD
jgi:hypothetical protein